MAYKVLGQAAASAASTAVYTVNYIKDPVFGGEPNNTSASTTAMTALNSSLWKAQERQTVNPTTVGTAVSGTIVGDVASTFKMTEGTGTLSGTIYLGYGTDTSSAGTGVDTSGADAAISVTAGTTYYYGGYFYRGNTGVSSATLEVRWFDNTSTFLSSSSVSVSFTTGSYVQTKSSAVAPSGAVYAAIRVSVSVTGATAWDFRASAFHFSDKTEADTAFPVPSVNGIYPLASPYTYEKLNRWEGTANTSNTVYTYTGAFSDLYTVPANSSTVVSTIAVTNTGTSTTNYRVGVVPTGETLTLKHFINFVTTISPGESHYYTNGMTLPSSSKIQVSAASTAVVFSAFGSEN
jgi:hypothetical protein